MADDVKTEATEQEPTPKAPEPPAPAPAPKISLDPNDYVKLVQQVNELKTQLDAVKAAKDAELDRERQAALEKLATEKGAQAALEEQRKQLLAEKEAAAAEAQQTRSLWLAEKRDATIAQSISGREFASDAARQQALMILNSRFETVLENGKPVVRDATTKRPASEVLPELVNGPELAHFFVATTKGGSGTKGTGLKATDPEPANLTPGQLAIQLAKKQMTRTRSLGIHPVT